MKKLLFLVLICSFLLVGCGSSKKVERNKYNNSIECTTDPGLLIQKKLIIYFDKDDKVYAFDFYESSWDDTLEEEYAERLGTRRCDGYGDFKKSWIEECSYEFKDDYLNMHYFINNGEYFGGLTTKSQILDYHKGYNYTCVEK